MRTVLSRAVRPRLRHRSWLASLVVIALVLGPATSLDAHATGLDLARNDSVSRAAKTRQTLTRVIESMQLVDPGLLGADRIAALADAHTQVGQMTDSELEELDEWLGPQLEQMSAALDALRAIDPGGDGRTLLTDPGFPDAAYPVRTSTSITTGAGTDLEPGEDRCQFTEGICVVPTDDACSETSDCGAGQTCIAFKCNDVGAICHTDLDCAAGTCNGGDTCDAQTQPDSADNVAMALAWGCDREDRSTVDEAYDALIAFITVEAVRDVASRICNQDYGFFFVGFNLSVVCIIVDVAYLYGKSLYTNLDLCDRFINAAEIAATYDRLEHAHVDIELHDANIKGDLTQATTAVNARTASAEALLQQQIATHDDEIEDKLMQHDTEVKATLTQHDVEIKADVAQHDADIKALLAASRAFKLRLEIEEALYRNERDAIYYLPEPAGNAGLARQIVVEAMANVAASGESVYYAQGKLNASDSEAARGNHKRAFSFLAQAYFEAIKIIGERQ